MEGELYDWRGSIFAPKRVVVHYNVFLPTLTEFHLQGDTHLESQKIDAALRGKKIESGAVRVSKTLTTVTPWVVVHVRLNRQKIKCEHSVYKHHATISSPTISSPAVPAEGQVEGKAVFKPKADSKPKAVFKPKT